MTLLILATLSRSLRHKNLNTRGRGELPLSDLGGEPHESNANSTIRIKSMDPFAVDLSGETTKNRIPSDVDPC